MIKDSGERRQFYNKDGKPLGVRDIQEGKGRCDLLPLDIVCGVLSDPVLGYIADFQNTGNEMYLYEALHRTQDMFSDKPTMMLEVSKHFEEGAKKYEPNNWKRGIPTRCYVDSMTRHYLKWLRGDTDEPHHLSFVWNVLTCIWTCIHKPELNDYGKEEKSCHDCIHFVGCECFDGKTCDMFATEE